MVINRFSFLRLHVPVLYACEWSYIIRTVMFSYFVVDLDWLSLHVASPVFDCPSPLSLFTAVFHAKLQDSGAFDSGLKAGPRLHGIEKELGFKASPAKSPPSGGGAARPRRGDRPRAGRAFFRAPLLTAARPPGFLSGAAGKKCLRTLRVVPGACRWGVARRSPAQPRGACSRPSRSCLGFGLAAAPRSPIGISVACLGLGNPPPPF